MTSQSTRIALLTKRRSVAAHDVDGVFGAAAAGYDHGLRRTARHIRPIRRNDVRRIAMGVIPGYIIGVAVAHVVGERLRNLGIRFARVRTVVEAAATRPHHPGIPVMKPRSRSADM